MKLETLQTLYLCCAPHMLNSIRAIHRGGRAAGAVAPEKIKLEIFMLLKIIKIIL